MKLLLDTHIFLWYVAGDPQLSTTVQNKIRDPNNQVYLSVVSVWEAVIKHELGKLSMFMPMSPEVYLPMQRQVLNIQTLDINESALLHLPKLPPLHRDPFDRILICQAMQHGLTIVTVDAMISKYNVPTMG